MKTVRQTGVRALAAALVAAAVGSPMAALSASAEATAAVDSTAVGQPDSHADDYTSLPTMAPRSTTQLWTSGWDNFGEPLDGARSKITWSVNAKHALTVNYILVGANKSKLYETGIYLFNVCGSKPPTVFGRFPLEGCDTITRQNVTATVGPTDIGVVTTDIKGNGSVAVNLGPIKPGTYKVEFSARDGAGCMLTGGGGDATCNVDFQSPGPFGTTTTIVVP